MISIGAGKSAFAFSVYGCQEISLGAIDKADNGINFQNAMTLGSSLLFSWFVWSFNHLASLGRQGNFNLFRYEAFLFKIRENTSKSGNTASLITFFREHD